MHFCSSYIWTGYCTRFRYRTLREHCFYFGISLPLSLLHFYMYISGCYERHQENILMIEIMCQCQSPHRILTNVRKLNTLIIFSAIAVRNRHVTKAMIQRVVHDAVGITSPLQIGAQCCRKHHVLISQCCDQPSLMLHRWKIEWNLLYYGSACSNLKIGLRSGSNTPYAWASRSSS